MDTALRDSYETCRRLHRRHDPTYYWATRRLPREIRPATHALYGYVRTADEIVDGPRRNADPAARRAALDAWEAELEAGRARQRPAHPIVRALVDAGDRHDLPLDELRVYMQSMRIDCGPVDMEAYEDLDAYMNGSAGTVGRIMATLLGVPEVHREDFARLGKAFQLTNFIRDVREDHRLGRVYLPAEEREHFGVRLPDLGAETAGPEVRALVAHQVDRARALFAGCEHATAATPRSVQPGMRIAIGVYRAVLDRVERTGHDVLGSRTAPRPWDFAAGALGR